MLLAALLGGFIGLEREYKKKEAGLRTYSLVALGACFFVIVAFESFNVFKNEAAVDFDPTRIIGQIAVGIGFLGAGLIIFRGFHVEGLTTAAGLWVTAAVGVAVGAKLYLPSVFVALLAVIVLAGLRFAEEKFFRK
ncbi:MAG: putative Mg2+ transporter-C (MgtC) family protein [Parcubacteria group bacterium Gr01-1014_30]|nr:MAG: putative Mg2+ transporter-C (MgtC) family protein [Parcubacteria group bacterium Gr01-1014_30]